MATRNPASTALPNFRGCDWYEPYVGTTPGTGWTAQKGTACPQTLNSAQIYGHDTWDGSAVVVVNPIMVEYGS